MRISFGGISITDNFLSESGSKEKEKDKKSVRKGGGLGSSLLFDILERYFRLGYTVQVVHIVVNASVLYGRHANGLVPQTLVSRNVQNFGHERWIVPFGVRANDRVCKNVGRLVHVLKEMCNFVSKRCHLAKKIVF